VTAGAKTPATASRQERLFLQLVGKIFFQDVVEAVLSEGLLMTLGVAACLAGRIGAAARAAGTGPAQGMEDLRRGGNW